MPPEQGRMTSDSFHPYAQDRIIQDAYMFQEYSITASIGICMRETLPKGTGNLYTEYRGDKLQAMDIDEDTDLDVGQVHTGSIWQCTTYNSGIMVSYTDDTMRFINRRVLALMGKDMNGALDRKRVSRLHKHWQTTPYIIGDGSMVVKNNDLLVGKTRIETGSASAAGTAAAFVEPGSKARCVMSSFQRFPLIKELGRYDSTTAHLQTGLSQQVQQNGLAAPHLASGVPVLVDDNIQTINNRARGIIAGQGAFIHISLPIKSYRKFNEKRGGGTHEIINYKRDGFGLRKPWLAALLYTQAAVPS